MGNAKDSNAHDFPVEMGKVAPRALKEHGINNIVQASKLTENELLKIHGVGPKAIRVLQDRLAQLGLSLPK